MPLEFNAACALAAVAEPEVCDVTGYWSAVLGGRKRIGPDGMVARMADNTGQGGSRLFLAKETYVGAGGSLTVGPSFAARLVVSDVDKPVVVLSSGTGGEEK